MNEIIGKIKFNNYEFRRVKTMGNVPIVYTKEDWIGKAVCVIPMPITINDRIIEKEKEGDSYSIEVPLMEIKRMVVRDGKKVGRISVPSSWIGLDVLVIEEPDYANLF